MNKRNIFKLRMEWINFTKKIHGWHKDYAVSQWNLYWSGVRDGRLHDATIWLIDRYGY